VDVAELTPDAVHEEFLAFMVAGATAQSMLKWSPRLLNWAMRLPV
jgi:hypothetical protein